MATELATAYVSLVPSFQGGARALATQMGAPAQAAGVTAGKRFGGSFSATISKAAKLAGVALFGAFAVKGVKGFLDFDAKMTESLAIMGDISGPMRKKMEDAARSVGKTTTFSAAEAAEAYFFLASAGLDAEQAVSAMPQVAKFAQAGMFDMARATDLATDAQSALGLSVKDPAKNLENLTRVTDVFVKANTLANTSVEQIAEAFTNKAGAALRNVNKDIEEGAAVLAAFADQGLKGAAAGEALNIVTRDLQNAALKNADAFKEAGIAVFDADGNMRNYADVIGDLEDHLAGMSDEQKRAALSTLGFQDRSVSNLVTLLGTSDAIRQYEAELREAGGTTDLVANKQLESFRARLTLIKSRIDDAALSLGKGLVNALFWLGEKLAPVGDWLKTTGVPAFKSWASQARDVLVPALRSLGSFLSNTVLPAVVDLGRWLVNYQGWLIPLAAAIGALVVGWKAYVTVVKVITAVKKAYIAVQAALNAVMAANPIGLVVIALVALAAAVVVAWKRSETFRNVVTKVWESFKRAVRTAWEGVIKPVLKFIVGYYKWVWETAKKLASIVVKAWRQLRDGIKAAWDFIKRNVIDRYIKAAQWVWDKAVKVKDGVVRAWRGLRDGVKAAWDWVKKHAIDPLVRGFQRIWDKAKSIRKGVTDTFRKLRDAIGAIFKAAVERIKSPIRSAFKWINKHLINNLNKVTSKFGLTIPSLPEKFHTGGVIPGRGETLITALGGEGVVSPKGMAAIGGKRGLDAINSGAAFGGPLDFIKRGLKAISGQVGDWLKQGAAFALDKIMGAVLAGTGLIPAGFARTLITGVLKDLRPKVKEWGAGKDLLTDESVAGSTAGAAVAASGWARPIGRGYRIGRGSAAHGYPALDLPAPTGTPIFAAVAGRVIQSLDSAVSYGKRVMTTGPAGRMVYAHMSRRIAQLNDVVRAGQLIGRVGSTGNSTGPHLHIEIGRNDPLSFLRRQGVVMDSGGTLAPGPNLVLNNTGGPETLRRVGLRREDLRSRTTKLELSVASGGDRRLAELINYLLRAKLLNIKPAAIGR